jgi:AcrR family transcriptional regulator
MVYHLKAKALCSLELRMGRKSIRLERTAQILDAFERCIAQFGLESTTLQDIADEAGMTRSILRHYIGNRDDIVNALIQRLDDKYDSRRKAFLNEQAGIQRIESLMEYLIEGWFEFGRDDDTIFTELIAASERDAKLRQRMLASYESLETSMAEEINRTYLHLPADICRTIAHAIMCVAFGHSTMLWLGFDRARYPELQQILGAFLQILESKEATRAVVAGLESPRNSYESENRATLTELR